MHCLSACSSMDRAFDYGSKGWEFESLQARQLFLTKSCAVESELLEATLESQRGHLHSERGLLFQ